MLLLLLLHVDDYGTFGVGDDDGSVEKWQGMDKTIIRYEDRKNGAQKAVKG